MTSPAIVGLLSVLISSGVIGIMLNMIIISLIASKKDLRADYNWFLFGMACWNVLYSIDLCILQPITLLMDIKPTHAMCQITGMLMIMCATGTILTQPILAINRYSTIFHGDRRPKVFRRMAFAYTLAIAVSSSYFVLGDYGRFGETLCCFDIVAMPFHHFLLPLMLPLTVGYGICIFCAIKVTARLKSHEIQMQNLEMQSQIRETKQIVKLIYIELLVPVMLEFPALTMCIFMKYSTVPETVVVIGVSLFCLHSVTDPLVIMLVLKPYRLAIKSLWDKYLAVNKETTITLRSGQPKI